jgi:hypothetical protein
MPHNYIVMGTNPSNDEVKQDVDEVSRGRAGATGRNTYYFDDDNKRAFAFCGFDTVANARRAIGPMVQRLEQRHRVYDHGVVATATELRLRRPRSGSDRRRRARTSRGGRTRRRGR